LIWFEFILLSFSYTLILKAQIYPYLHIFDAKFKIIWIWTCYIICYGFHGKIW